MPGVIPNPGLRQQNAAELVRTIPLPALENAMKSMVEAEANPFEARVAASSALLALDQQNYAPLIARNLDNTNQPAWFREKVAAVLAEVNSQPAREAVLRALVAAPFRAQIKLAHLLAANAAGAEALLNLAEARKLSAQVLLDRSVKDRLIVAKLPRLKERYEKLTAGLAPANAELQKLIQARQAGFDPEEASTERGAVVFEKNCAVCHQMNGKGAVVGPQLDGVGTRGLERLIEDVLDSNRNVDPAFRATNLTLKDDTAITGLLRREEGEVIVFADTTGKEISVRKSDIAERRESELSLMPSNFGDLLTVQELNDLLAFLLPPPA
jgi:putative heme-binding domain-containing protein